MEAQENTKSNKKQEQKKVPSEMYYDITELQRLRYVKVIYTGLDGNLREISTDVKFIGEKLISVYFKYNEAFNINYPQEVILKFVTTDAMYLAKAVLQEIKKTDTMVYFSLIPPTKMIKKQNRKYVRVNLNRACVLVITDEQGRSSTYLTKTINLSACGILLHDLETLDSNDIIREKVEMSKYDCYQMILFLEHDIVLKLFGIFVRHECVNNSYRYAFRFLNLKQKDTDLICKYVANEQVKQLKQMLKIS